MRAVFGMVLVVGVALAGAAVYMAQSYLGKTQAALNAERELRARTGPMVEVFVLNKPLKYGDPVTPEDVKTIFWQENSLPETIFREAAVLFPENADGPRFAMRNMDAFEPVLATRVTEPGEMAGLTGKLEKGMRAFAIKVDVTSGVSGFLMPDDHVDVYWTGAGGEGTEITRLIESSVKLIAVDQTSNDDRSVSATVARTVTVAVNPEQVGRLAQAQATGRLALSLVGSAEESVGEPIEVTSNDITGAETYVAPEVKQERVCTIRTNKGGEITEIPIACTN
jgi:pilus assembly protein CpaB